MKTLFSLLTLVLVATPPTLQAADDDLAVIVNKNNSVDNLTKAQLRKLLLGEQTSWPGGKKVTVILRATGQPERNGILRSVCGMGEEEFNQQLMQSAFGGSTAPAPKALSSAEAVRQLVVNQPGGIGFVRIADVNDSVKVVMVNGIAAGQPGYIIKTK